jgi:hypothetical protein
MSDYHAYIVGPGGHFIGVHQIAAADQNEAVQKAIRLLDGHAVEVWNGDEYIGTLKPNTLGRAPTFKRPANTQKLR